MLFGGEPSVVLPPRLGRNGIIKSIYTLVGANTTELTIVVSFLRSTPTVYAWKEVVNFLFHDYHCDQYKNL